MRFILALFLCAASLANAVKPTDFSGLTGYWVANSGITTAGTNGVTVWDGIVGPDLYWRNNSPTWVSSDTGTRFGSAISFTAGSNTQLTTTASLGISNDSDRTMMWLSYPFGTAEGDVICSLGTVGVCGGLYWAPTDTTIYSCTAPFDTTGLTQFGNRGGTAYQVHTAILVGGTVTRYMNKTKVSDAVASPAQSTSNGIMLGNWQNLDRASGKRLAAILVYSEARSQGEIEALVDWFLLGEGSGIDRTIDYYQYLFQRLTFFLDMIATQAHARTRNTKNNGAVSLARQRQSERVETTRRVPTATLTRTATPRLGSPTATPTRTPRVSPTHSPTPSR